MSDSAARVRLPLSSKLTASSIRAHPPMFVIRTFAGLRQQARRHTNAPGFWFCGPFAGASRAPGRKRAKVRSIKPEKPQAHPRPLGFKVDPPHLAAHLLSVTLLFCS